MTALDGGGHSTSRLPNFHDDNSRGGTTRSMTINNPGSVCRPLPYMVVEAAMFDPSTTEFPNPNPQSHKKEQFRSIQNFHICGEMTISVQKQNEQQANMNRCWWPSHHRYASYPATWRSAVFELAGGQLQYRRQCRIGSKFRRRSNGRCVPC